MTCNKFFCSLILVFDSSKIDIGVLNKLSCLLNIGLVSADYWEFTSMKSLRTAYAFNLPCSNSVCTGQHRLTALLRFIAGLVAFFVVSQTCYAEGGNIIINGRQPTIGERAYLEQTCQMQASFNLSLCAPPSGQRSTRTFCDADGSCSSSGIFGSIFTSPRWWLQVEMLFPKLHVAVD